VLPGDTALTYPLTPGAYLKARRTAQHVTIESIVERVGTLPHVPWRERVQLIEMIEADAQPASFATIVALRGCYSFDLDVLAQLEAIAQGTGILEPQLCRICACSEHDACNDHGHGCCWIKPDLCSACATADTATLTQGAAA
jgi:transcriptional regulator with XRE-family HTH domain